MKRTCRQCGKEFIITQSEIKFYKDKNLSLPKRCKECRESNKKQKIAEAADITADITKAGGAYMSRLSEQEKGKHGKHILYTIGIVILSILAIVCGIYAISTWENGDYDDNSNSGISEEDGSASGAEVSDIYYSFRNDNLLNSHYEKHGIEMGFASAEEYEAAANQVIIHEDVLHKIESEDGDDVYYLESTNEFVIVSTDGYLRTYFYPGDGLDYYNRQ